MLSYLTKRLVQEKGYAVWGTVADDGCFVSKGLSAAEMPAEGPVCTFPELAAIDADVDVILVRSDGMSFQVVALRTARFHAGAGALDEFALRDRLARVAEACQRYAGSVNGANRTRPAPAAARG